MANDDNKRASELTKKVLRSMEGESLGDVMMVGVGILSSVIKQAKPADREMMVPVMEMFFKKLSEITRDPKN